ncbi:unnamed protein product, partial [Brassica oleracea]
MYVIFLFIFKPIYGPVRVHESWGYKVVIVSKKHILMFIPFVRDDLYASIVFLNKKE